MRRIVQLCSFAPSLYRDQPIPAFQPPHQRPQPPSSFWHPSLYRQEWMSTVIVPRGSLPCVLPEAVGIKPTELAAEKAAITSETNHKLLVEKNEQLHSSRRRACPH